MPRVSCEDPVVLVGFVLGVDTRWARAGRRPEGAERSAHRVRVVRGTGHSAVHIATESGLRYIEDLEILVRADSAGATHGLIDYCREANLRFSVGFELTE